MRPVLERFLEKISVSDIHFYEDTPCLEWTGYTDRDGYGRFWYNGKKEYVHRISYELIKGKIPEGLVINHLCRNHCCCNPDHLETITNKENVQKGLAGQYQRLKTHCPEGHEYSEENTYIDTRGRRRCRICSRIHKYEFNQRKKQNQP